MNDPQRSYVIAGCDEMLAVRLLAKDGNVELRAFNQSVQLRAEGQVRASPSSGIASTTARPRAAPRSEIEVEAAGRPSSACSRCARWPRSACAPAPRSNGGISLEFGGFRSRERALALALARSEQLTNGTVQPGKGAGKGEGTSGTSPIHARRVGCEAALVFVDGERLADRREGALRQAGRCIPCSPCRWASPRSDRRRSSPLLLHETIGVTRVAAEARPRTASRSRRTALATRHGARDPQVAPAVGHLRVLGEDPPRLSKRSVHVPQPARASPAREMEVGHGLALRDVARAIDADEEEGHAARIGPLQGAEAVADRPETRGPKRAPSRSMS